MPDIYKRDSDQIATIVRSQVLRMSLTQQNIYHLSLDLL